MRHLFFTSEPITAHYLIPKFQIHYGGPNYNFGFRIGTIKLFYFYIHFGKRNYSYSNNGVMKWRTI